MEQFYPDAFAIMVVIRVLQKANAEYGTLKRKAKPS